MWNVVDVECSLFFFFFFFWMRGRLVIRRRRGFSFKSVKIRLSWTPAECLFLSPTRSIARHSSSMSKQISYFFFHFGAVLYNLRNLFSSSIFSSLSDSPFFFCVFQISRLWFFFSGTNSVPPSIIKVTSTYYYKSSIEIPIVPFSIDHTSSRLSHPSTPISISIIYFPTFP